MVDDRQTEASTVNENGGRDDEGDEEEVVIVDTHVEVSFLVHSHTPLDQDELLGRLEAAMRQVAQTFVVTQERPRYEPPEWIATIHRHEIVFERYWRATDLR